MYACQIRRAKKVVVDLTLSTDRFMNSESRRSWGAPAETQAEHNKGKRADYGDDSVPI